VRNYLSGPAKPTLLTVSDRVFRRAENNALVPMFDLRGNPRPDPMFSRLRPFFITAMPDAKMPDITARLQVARWQTIFALALDQNPRRNRRAADQTLLPPLREGTVAVTDPALYVPAELDLKGILTVASNMKFYETASTRAIIRHERGNGIGRRHDSLQTFCDLLGVGSNDTPTIDLEFDRQKIQGGHLTAVSTWGNHFFPFSVGRIKDQVLGENPPKPAIHAEIRRQATAAGLGVWINSLLAIAYQESTFHQFIDYGSGANPDEGFPFKGTRKGEDSTDWGIMQLDAVTYPDARSEGYRPFHGYQETLAGKVPVTLWPPPARQLWDWKANIAGGIQCFSAKLAAAQTHLAELLAIARKTDKDAGFTWRERSLEVMNRYNMGVMYWIGWDTANKKWIRHPGAMYADTVIKVRDAIEATPPVWPLYWFSDVSGDDHP
jgi:hypothetical protein